MKTMILAAMVAALSAASANAGGYAGYPYAGYDPSWPPADLVWPKLAADEVPSMVSTSIHPPRTVMFATECNSGFRGVQILPGSPFVPTVDGLPPTQYKIEDGHYGRFVLINGVLVEVVNSGLQVRGAAVSGTQHFQLKYSLPGEWIGGQLYPKPGYPLQVADTDDYYLTTTCK